jgi:ABC-type arginine transport system permease subunit
VRAYVNEPRGKEAACHSGFVRLRPPAVGAVLAAAILVLGACGGDSDGAAGDGVDLVESGRLTTCTHLPYPPFQFEQGGEIVGFDVDLIDRVARELGVEQQIVDTPFEGIQSGEDLNADVPGGVTGTITVALGLVAAAYIAETIRAGIQAVPKGQMEAARSLGMSNARAMISIVIPQAFRIVLPPLTNELILLTKDSSLVYLLGVTLQTRELAKFGRDALNQYVSMTPILVAGLCYLIITVPLGYLVRRLEARQARAR